VDDEEKIYRQITNEKSFFFLLASQKKEKKEKKIEKSQPERMLSTFFWGEKKFSL
jgi:hypothetical protein